MGTSRMTRVNELIKREIASELYRLVNEVGFDLSAVTVTQVMTSSNLRHARVLISIRDHKGERQKMLGQLARHRATIQQQINRHLSLKYTPQLTFELDESIEKGDHVLNLISQLEDDYREQHPEDDDTEQPPQT